MLVSRIYIPVVTAFCCLFPLLWQMANAQNTDQLLKIFLNHITLLNPPPMQHHSFCRKWPPLYCSIDCVLLFFHTGVFLHVLADTLGSVGVIISAGLIYQFGKLWKSPTVNCVLIFSKKCLSCKSLQMSDWLTNPPLKL